MCVFGVSSLVLWHFKTLYEYENTINVNKSLHLFLYICYVYDFINFDNVGANLITHDITLYELCVGGTKFEELFAQERPSHPHQETTLHRSEKSPPPTLMCEVDCVHTHISNPLTTINYWVCWIPHYSKVSIFPAYKLLTCSLF